MKKTVFIWVLGATGYVGKHLVAALLKHHQSNPHVQIVAVGHQRIDPLIMERTHFLMMPLSAIDSKWFERYPPSTIFHCARMAGSTDRKRFRAARKGERANRRLKAMLMALPHKPKVVYCSGTLMYGSSETPVVEGADERPIAYARAYERAERPWKEQSAGLDVRIAYPAWILGADSWFEAFYLKPAALHGCVWQIEDGQALMNVVHVRDVAGQLIHIDQHGESGERYNIFGGPAITQGDFARLISSALQVELAAVSKKELVASYGKTNTEALCSSIPVSTKHQEWKKRYKLKYSSEKEMIAAVLKDYFTKS
jgi:nucleoside-diphosphate-sugar epimerase